MATKGTTKQLPPPRYTAYPRKPSKEARDKAAKDLRCQTLREQQLILRSSRRGR